MKITCISGDGQLVQANTTSQSKPIIIQALNDNGSPAPGVTVAVVGQVKQTGPDGTASFVISGGTLPESLAFSQMEFYGGHLTRYYVSPQMAAYVLVQLMPGSFSAGKVGKSGDAVKVKVFCSYGMQAGQGIPNVLVRCSAGDAAPVMTGPDGTATIVPSFSVPGFYSFDVVVGESATFKYFQMQVSAPNITVASPVDIALAVTGGTPPYTIGATTDMLAVTVFDASGQAVNANLVAKYRIA